jgi:hypothetical protein
MNAVTAIKARCAAAHAFLLSHARSAGQPPYPNKP